MPALRSLLKAVTAFFCLLIATTASAEQFEFRGDFVKTYVVEENFVQSLPKGTVMACIKKRGCARNKRVCKERYDNHCSRYGGARIYVFKDASGKEKTFWTADIDKKLYDTEEQILMLGTAYRIEHDETNQ